MSKTYCIKIMQTFNKVYYKKKMNSNPKSFVLHLLEKPILCIFDDNKNPFFRIKDAAEILEYQWSKNVVKDYVQLEDQVLFETFPIAVQQSLPNVHKQTLFMNETGLYSLASKSTQPRAGELRRWIASTLQPSIRKFREDALKRENQKLFAELQEVNSELLRVKSDRVILPEDRGKCQIFALVKKNVFPCEDGETCCHPLHVYRVMRVQEDRYSYSLKKLQRNFPRLKVIFKINDNPNVFILNERIRAWGKRTRLIRYYKNDIFTSLSETELTDVILEIHNERLQ